MQLTKEQTKSILNRSRADPVWWCENVLGVRLWQKQKDIIEAVRDHARVAVRSSDSIGKSFVAACIALWFLYNFRPATVLTTAPTGRQVKDILWREIAARHGTAKYPLGGKLNQVQLEIDTDWFAIGLSTDEPERFQGYHNENVLVIGDEASGLPEMVYLAFENPLASGNAKLLLIGNPTQITGGFYRAFTSEIYKTFHVSAFDTPNLAGFGLTVEDFKNKTWKDKIGNNPLPYPSLTSPQWVADQLADSGEGGYNFRVHVKGEFPETGVNNLFSIAEIEACQGIEVSADGDKIAALDVARYGLDESVYLLRQGGRVLKIERWGHQDTVYTTGRTVRLMREDNPATIRVDDIGVGGGVADQLIKEEMKVERVNVGMPATDTEHFLNRRAELYWLLHKRFVDKKISIPVDRALVGQLVDIRYTYNGKGQLVIESKEDAAKRGSKSPDIADALMMAFIPRPAGGEMKPRTGYDRS